MSHLEISFGVTVDGLYHIYSLDNALDNMDSPMYRASDLRKLECNIEFDEDGTPQVSSNVYRQWPQVRMCVHMLSRLPSTSGSCRRQRNLFLGLVKRKKENLDTEKERFHILYNGPVSKAYQAVYEPQDEKDKAHFDMVLGKSKFLEFGVCCHTASCDEW